jgi:hypothetical protein
LELLLSAAAAASCIAVGAVCDQASALALIASNSVLNTMSRNGWSAAITMSVAFYVP